MAKARGNGSKPAKQPVIWRDRIIPYEEYEQRGLPQRIAPDQLLAHPLNARMHGKAQQDALLGTIHEIGFTDEIEVGINTQHVLDGHLRVLLAMRENQPTIRVKWLDLEESEEPEYIATKDPIAAMASWDKTNLDALLRSVQSGEAAVQEMLAELARQSGLRYGEEAKADLELSLVPEVPDALLPTDNEWGVPVLRLDRQATTLLLPVQRWGAQPRKSKMMGTYHFYTEDYKFSALWDDPSGLLASGCQNIIEPNLSTSMAMPRAVALWDIYRKRWLARWAQDNGIRVFVDLNVEPNLMDLDLLGVPKGWRAFATRGRESDDAMFLPLCFETARTVAQTGDVLFVVYGGGHPTRQACQEHSWLWIPEESAASRERYQHGER